MNALSLYVTTCRRVFESDPDDSGAWADIYRLMSLLRQALSCSVCSNLLQIPMTSPSSSCQHSVCKGCVGKKMRLKPTCPCSKNYGRFAENVQLRVLLQCYKKFCDYLSTSALGRKWDSVNGGTNLSIHDIVVEGASLCDEYRYGNRRPRKINGDRPRKSVANGSPSARVTETNGSSSDNSDSPVPSAALMHYSREKPIRRGCRCGLATLNPGKLTCCGQRCPCYVANTSCAQCKCRGCRNPLDKPSEVWGDGLEVAANESIKLDEEENDSFEVEVDE
ncbi:E3 ubiquitin-protein ligase MSL2-like [Ornithodoros turicata]|uniref:Putative e3 ubiquitin-protein ligase msl2 n=1 Tax=Ornithodoros turicata TaxID=34597 RepID=A0A2R5LIB6_9ACAR